MSKFSLLLIPLLAACASAATTTSRPTPVDYGSPERISGRDAWLDVTMVPQPLRTPAMPLVGGYYVLYSQSGRFCTVDQAAWSTGPNDGEFFSCRWRWPRGIR